MHVKTWLEWLKDFGVPPNVFPRNFTSLSDEQLKIALSKLIGQFTQDEPYQMLIATLSRDKERIVTSNTDSR